MNGRVRDVQRTHISFLPPYPDGEDIRVRTPGQFLDGISPVDLPIQGSLFPRFSQVEFAMPETIPLEKYDIVPTVFPRAPTFEAKPLGRNY